MELSVPNLDAIRAQIGAVIDEIAANALHREATDPDDSEAYEIVRRIERRLRGTPMRQPAEAAA
jgi:hypothetical protein